MAIFEMRTFKVLPGRMADYLQLVGTLGLEVQSATRSNLVGCFTTETGELNQVVQIWRWESWEERNVRRSKVLEHPRFHEYSAAGRALVTDMTSQLLSPVAFSGMT